MRLGLIILCIGYVLSQFFRAFLAVLTDVLAQDIGTTADDLATASGLWFLTFAAMQIPVGWALIYLITAVFYAFEGNYIAKWGTAGLNAFQVMYGASLVGVVIMGPVMLLSGQTIVPEWPLPPAQGALVAASVVHVLVYAAYVWLAGRAGAVFVTGFGLIWASLILDESYQTTIWLALAFMFAGMFLVQPRPKLATEPRMPETGT